MLLNLRIVLLIGLLAVGCAKKEVQLPHVEQALEQKVEDYSEIFIFFDEMTQQAQLNKNNLITSTNWVFHIDKRNTLFQAGQYIEQMQTQKKNPRSPHSKPDSQNYLSVALQPQKVLGFINFTATDFKAYDFSLLEAQKEEVFPILVEKEGLSYKGKQEELSYFYHFAPKEKVIWIFDGAMRFDEFVRIFSTLKANQTDIPVVYYKKSQ